MSRNRISTLIAGLLMALALTAGAQEAALPDEIVLKNGSRILGTVTEARDGVVKIETDFAGTLMVSTDQIESMRTQQPTVVLLADETVIRDQPLQVEDAQVVAGQQSYALEELLVLNPRPWELGEGYRWTGLINFAWALQRGNTDTDELDYRLETIWRSKRDRYTLNAYGELDETNNVKSADNWGVQGKYDYFIGDDMYWGVSASAEHDKFADLDLRYLIGPYIGRDFFEDPIFTLAAEIGIAYVNEDFIVAPDQDYPAADWNVRMSSNYLGGDSSLYLRQTGIWNLEETSEWIINTAFGLAFPLLWNIEAAAEVTLDYDSGAVEGVEELDQTYRLRIGYRW
jgi:opacity protein-like surface antigen